MCTMHEIEGIWRNPAIGCNWPYVHFVLTQACFGNVGDYLLPSGRATRERWPLVAVLGRGCKAALGPSEQHSRYSPHYAI
eukprot:362713-Chlamydomonas_euryale.AAC.6